MTENTFAALIFSMVGVLYIKSAVEELLRYTSPVMMTTERYAVDNATMHDMTIPRGEMILA